MSLLQAALDRAEEPLPQEDPKNALPKTVESPGRMNSVDLVKPAQHEEPRLNAIRFYETENQAVEKAITENRAKKTEAAKAQEALLNLQKKEQRTNFWGIIGVLLVLSLAASWFLFPSFKNDSASVAAVPAAESLLPPKPEPVFVKIQKMSPRKPTGQVKFLLTGITSADEVLLALINNQVVGVGDRLREGATVKSITPNSVVLEVNGRQVVLNF